MTCKQHTAQWKTLLRSNKLKATPARVELLDSFKHSKKPLSVRDLAALHGTQIDKTTFYRNLESLSSSGVIRKIFLADREIYYELVDQKHHHHVTCKKCGKIANVTGCKVSIEDTSLLKSSGFAKVDDHSLEFFGVCKRCTK